MNNFLSAYLGSLAAMITVAIILIIVGMGRAEAQGVPCGPTDLIEQELRADYGERLRATRDGNFPGGSAELWTNPETGSYTVLVSPEPGITCILDAGQADSLKEREA